VPHLPPPIDPSPVTQPWVSWEPCAIGRRGIERMVRTDLPHGTLAREDAIRWQRAGRIVLRR
jgi:hypothetical protein